MLRPITVSTRWVSKAPFGVRFASSKVFPSCEAAVADIQDGSKVVVAGFGLAGLPENLLRCLKEKGSKDLTVISSNAGTDKYGVGVLLEKRQVKRVVCSYIGENPLLEALYIRGEVALDFTPQGTLAEKLRCGGAGIPAFFTHTGVNTVVQNGGVPIRRNPDGTIAEYSVPREYREFNGRGYIMEEAIKGDFALIKGAKADTMGNIVFHRTARNFNPDCAKAAKVCIAEVDEIVPAGALDPDSVHLPGIYVHRLIQAKCEKPIERRTLSGTSVKLNPVRGRIAHRAAKELKNGMYVNLGIGIPTLAANFIPHGVSVDLHSENGAMGVGPYPREDQVDPELINASKETVTLNPGASIFCSSESFTMVRGGHMSMTIIGGLQVAANGDLANWIIPGKLVKGMGGAMDLVASGSRVVIAMEHITPLGDPKILKQCTLPLTGAGCVNRIITDLAVIDVTPKGLLVVELAHGTTKEEVIAKTEAPLMFAEELGEY